MKAGGKRIFQWVQVLSVVILLGMHSSGRAMGGAMVETPPEYTKQSCQGFEGTLEALNQPRNPDFAYDAQELSRWFTTEEPQGVALVIHGLNLRPSKMNSLVEFLNASHWDVLRLSLTGHRGSVDEMKQTQRENWLEDVWRGYCLLEQHASAKGLKHKLFLGYSLGGLMMQDLMNLPDLIEPIAFDQQVLLAPALSFRTISYFVKAFGILGGGFVVPSWNFPEYRMNRGTTMAAYWALFEAQAHLEETRMQKSLFPTLVLIDPDDELVSPDGIEEQIRSFDLTSWKQVLVSKKDAELDGYSHNLVDEKVLGKQGWEQLLEHIRGFLASSN